MCLKKEWIILCILKIGIKLSGSLNFYYYTKERMCLGNHISWTRTRSLKEATFYKIKTTKHRASRSGRGLGAHNCEVSIGCAEMGNTESPLKVLSLVKIKN